MNADRREMTDTCLIVSGGPTDRKFAAEFVKNRKYPYVIAVDAGLAVCEELGLVPDLAVGDFDTFGLERMEELRKKEGWATDVRTTMAAMKAAGDIPYIIGSIEAGEKGVTLC